MKCAKEHGVGGYNLCEKEAGHDGPHLSTANGEVQWTDEPVKASPKAAKAAKKKKGAQAIPESASPPPPPASPPKQPRRKVL